MENIPWRREWLPTPVFLPGVFHGLRSLVAYSPWGQKGSHMTATNTFTSFTCITTHSSTYPLNTCLFVCLPVYLSTYLPTYLSIPLYKHNEFLPIQFKSKVTRVLLVFFLFIFVTFLYKSKRPGPDYSQYIYLFVFCFSLFV